MMGKVDICQIMTKKIEKWHTKNYQNTTKSIKNR